MFFSMRLTTKKGGVAHTRNPTLANNHCSAGLLRGVIYFYCSLFVVLQFVLCIELNPVIFLGELKSPLIVFQLILIETAITFWS